MEEPEKREEGTEERRECAAPDPAVENDHDQAGEDQKGEGDRGPFSAPLAAPADRASVGSVRVPLAVPGQCAAQFFALSTSAFSLIHGIMPRSCSPTFSIGWAAMRARVALKEV